jgi:hypothetical protein
MLSDQNIGVNISLNLTNCLLFADDVVLMAESPRELQTLLQISHTEFHKASPKFNRLKSPCSSSTRIIEFSCLSAFSLRKLQMWKFDYHRLCKQVYNEMINNNDTFWDYDTLNLDIIRDVTPDVSCFESQSQTSLLLVCTSSIILYLVFVPNIEFREV